MLMRGGEKYSSGWRRVILVSWWSGGAERKFLPVECMAMLPLRRNVRSIGKADQAGVWRSLFLKDGAGGDEKKLVLGRIEGEH